MTIDDDRVRQLAYQIWESEGKPEGQEARHWEMARKLAESEKSETPAKPAPRTRRVSKPKAAPSAEQSEPEGEKPAVLKKPRAPRSTSKTPKV